MRVLIIGAGGHAQVVADILLCMRACGGNFDLLGFLDDNPALIGKRVLQYPVLGQIHQLKDIEHDAIVVAIGDNRIRRQIYCELESQGEQFIIARHPQSTLASDVRIGSGTVICAGVIVNTGSKIGANVILNTGATIDHHNTIGDHCHIAPGVHLGGDVSIGTTTLVGIGATVISQITVEEECIVGAGAVVHRNVPKQCTVTGVPARKIRGGTS